MAYYKDLREHIQALENCGKLIRIRKTVNKETELMPLVRWQFRGLPEEDRKAFLFENVIDSKGKKYDIPVLVASLAASRDVYAIGMKCQPDEIATKLTEARNHPLKPVIIDRGPAQEVVHQNDELLEAGGLAELPVPISTPGFDNAPYLTGANWISKDPHTGIRNVGAYRGMIKSADRCGIMLDGQQDLRTHWDLCRKKGIPLQVALVIGAVPAIGFVGVMKFPYGVDEIDIAGGIAGEPIELIKCKTVDIEVPATAEIIIEGEMPTDFMEREAPFGEASGYMGSPLMGPYLNVKCITHRKNPIYNAIISQFPPSESTKLRMIAGESSLLNFLSSSCRLPVTDVAMQEDSGAGGYLVIALKKRNQAQVWQALNGVVTNSPKHKFVIAVDDDIDPHDADSVNWAMCYRVQPDRDVRIIKGMMSSSLDYSIAPPTEHSEDYPQPSGASALLIDATTKWDYPPTSLPKKQFMDKARQIWDELGLPKLKPRKPWFGYSMGYWTDELEEEANLAVRSEYYKTGEKLAQQRIKVDDGDT